MISHKKIAIFGFAKEGVSSANYFGHNNKIFILDDREKNQIEKKYFRKLKVDTAGFYFGKNFPSHLDFDYVVRSPAVRLDNKIIQNLVASGAVLTSPTKIFFDECPCEIIGVTGTKGKGTTSTLIYEMLASQFSDVYLAGNIGTPALEILPKLKKESLVVLELSSFQLIDLKKSPHIAVILMVTSEHLDWHDDRQDYLKAKESIVAYQKKDDFAVVNLDFEGSRYYAQKAGGKVFYFSLKAKTNGVYLEKDKIISEIKKREQICLTHQILLPGKHNLQNVLAACNVAKIKSIKNENITKVLATFKGLSHRLQLVAKINGVFFINDSCSTIPETTMTALDAFENNKILILGGSSKNSNFSGLAKKILSDQRLKAIILIGQEASRIKSTIRKFGKFSGKIIEGAKNMPQIIKSARKIAKRGDLVILSPGCASFDMFKDYEDRGNQFIRAVKSQRVLK